MDSLSQKSLLISKEAIRPNIISKCGRKYILSIVFSVSFVILVTVTITAVTIKEKNHKNIKYLSDVLPKSFYIEFEGYGRHGTKWIKDDNTKYFIEWDNDVKDIRYLKVMTGKHPGVNEGATESRKVLEFSTNITIVNEEAVYTLVHKDTVMTSCYTNVYTDGLFYIFSLLSNATMKTELTSNKCVGRLWSVPSCNGEIYFCEKNSKIISILQGDRRVDMVKWETRKEKTIVLPQLNLTCRIEHRLFDDVKTCSDDYTEDRPKLLKAGLKKDCLFIHGVGVKTSRYSVVQSYPDYWGNIERNTPQCKSHKFIKMDTVNYGWDDNILQNNFCDFAGGINKIIRNKMIFSHSMGNLIVAAALFKKVCTLDSDSSKWYTIQAPWKGSKAANFLEKLCSGHFKGNIKITFAKLVSDVLVSLNYCTKSGKPTPAFHSLVTTYSSPFNISYTNLINTAKIYTSGAMCGYSSQGLCESVLLSSVLTSIEVLVDLERPNDGVVSFESCGIMGNFKDSFYSTFYKTVANHLEGTCRFGDHHWAPPGWKMDKPCSWYAQRNA